MRVFILIIQVIQHFIFHIRVLRFSCTMTSALSFISLISILNLCVCDLVMDPEEDLSALALTVYRNPNFYSVSHGQDNREQFGSTDSGFRETPSLQEEDESGLTGQYKYPGEPKRPARKRPIWKPIFYDDHPDFRPVPRDIVRNPNLKPNRGRGPYGHPRYKDPGLPFSGEVFKEANKYGQINPVVNNDCCDDYDNTEPRFFKPVEKITSNNDLIKKDFDSPPKRTSKVRYGKQKKWKSKGVKKDPRLGYNKLFLINKGKQPEHVLIFHHLDPKNKNHKIHGTNVDNWNSTPLDGSAPIMLSHEQDLEYEHIPQRSVDHRSPIRKF